MSQGIIAKPETQYCHLTIKMEDGQLVLRDDRGLKVKYVRGITYAQAYNDVSIAEVKIIVAGPRGQEMPR